MVSFEVFFFTELSVILNFHLQPEGVGDVETASYVAAFPAIPC